MEHLFGWPCVCYGVNAKAVTIAPTFHWLGIKDQTKVLSGLDAFCAGYSADI